MSRQTIRRGCAGYFLTPEQRYEINRARSARWEADRNREPLPFFVQRHSAIHGVIAAASMLACGGMLLALAVAVWH